MLLDPKMMKTYAIVSSAALTKVALIGLGYWVGARLDRSFGTAPLFMLLCICFGLALGIWGLVRALNRRND